MKDIYERNSKIMVNLLQIFQVNKGEIEKTGLEGSQNLREEHKKKYFDFDEFETVELILMPKIYIK